MDKRIIAAKKINEELFLLHAQIYFIDNKIIQATG